MVAQVRDAPPILDGKKRMRIQYQAAVLVVLLGSIVRAGPTYTHETLAQGTLGPGATQIPNLPGLTITKISKPCIDESGNVAFIAEHTAGKAILAYHQATKELKRIVVEDVIQPVIMGSFNDVSDQRLDGMGGVVFIGQHFSSTLGVDIKGIYARNIAAGPITILYESPLDGSGGAVVNGQLSVRGSHIVFTACDGADEALMRMSVSGGPTSVLVQTGDSAPGTGKTFSSFSRPQINIAGQVIFRGEYSNGLFEGVFRASGPGIVDALALDGAAVPNGAGNFISVNPPQVHINGNLAFAAEVQDGPAFYDAIYALPTGAGSVLGRVIDTSDDFTVPGEAGQFQGISNPIVSARYRVAFLGGTDGLLYTLLPSGAPITRIVEPGITPVPGQSPPVTFSETSSPTINNADIVMFRGVWPGGTGLFAYKANFGFSGVYLVADGNSNLIPGTGTLLAPFGLDPAAAHSEGIKWLADNGRATFVALLVGPDGTFDSADDTYALIRSTPATVASDFDFDFDVDGLDFSVFLSCHNGAGKPPKTAGCTGDADLDFDGDVDVNDFSKFAVCFNGAGNVPRCGL